MAGRAGGHDILSLTPSKVRDYQTCPQKYRLNNLIRFGSRGVSTSLSFGSSIHAALEEIHKSALATNVTVDCGDILRRYWKATDYLDRQESELYFSRGLTALCRYVELMGRPDGQIVGTELYLSRVIRLGGLHVRLACKVDRLELHRDGVLEALDYKTNAGGRVPTRESLAGDLATFIYYVLVRLSYPQSACVIVSQLNVLTLAKVEVDYNSAELAVHKQALVKVAREIESGAFEPRPGGACAWCRVRDHCPAFSGEADLDSLI